ncbi:MAG TPA: protoheme IX farnesyltransferase, partial [Myxococcaceae bacterium]|nr:protoheme IX farnesyltransferase [Myxococcaceae bacterium]
WLYPMGVAGGLYLAAASVLGAVFIGLGFKGYLRGAGAEWAKSVFAYSIVYLAALFAALWIDVGWLHR